MPVYLISENVERGPTKIGFSGTPEHRLQTMQTGNPRKLCLAYAFELATIEAELQLERLTLKRLSTNRISGEWFNVGAEVAKLAILSICAEHAWPIYSRPEGTVERPFGHVPNRKAQRRVIDSL